MNRGSEKQGKPSYFDPIIFPDTMGALEYEMQYLEPWRSSILYPLFIHVSHLLQEVIVRSNEQSPRPRKLPFSQGHYFIEGGSGEQLVTNNRWGIITPVSNTDPGEYTNSIHYTQIVIPRDLPQVGGNRGIIYF